MILSALTEYYDRLAGDGKVPTLGFSSEPISYALVLAPDGAVVDVQDTRVTTGKRPVPQRLTVPAAFKRPGTTPRPFFLWDKTSFLFGVERDKAGATIRTPKPHAAFKALHEERLRDATDPGLRAVLSFVRTWDPEQFGPGVFNAEMLNANFVFRLDGVQAYVHDSADARFIQSECGSNGTGSQGTCLVTGRRGALARLHPAIKGVDGAQSTGASIASFNADAYTSYRGSLKALRERDAGNDTGANAPVSEAATFAYTTVLNHLLLRGAQNRQRIQIGDATVVFWAMAADSDQAEQAEMLFSDLLNPPADDATETSKVSLVLQAVAKGAALRDLDAGFADDTRLYLLGLAPNASRLSIRYWETGTLGAFTCRLAQHYADLALDPPPARTALPIWRLLLATAPVRKGKSTMADVPPQLAGEILRAVLTGRRYPQSWLAHALMRMRADRDVSGVRAAICKAILTRDRRLGVHDTNDEEVPMSLDRSATNPGYRLGRLFAVLEDIQSAALGRNLNATIRDKFYGSASATPAAVFPMLLRSTQNHLARLRKDKPGLTVFFERELRDILDGFAQEFPRSLRLQDQGRFAIGYYQQSSARFAKADDTDATGTENQGEAA